MVEQVQKPLPPGYPRSSQTICRAASALRYAWTSAAVDGPRAMVWFKWVLSLAQRFVVAEAALLITIALCVLAGFPAIVTAFFAALVEFLVSIWLAVRTLGPVFRKYLLGGQ